MTRSLLAAAALLLTIGCLAAWAEEPLTCRGNIISKQGEGLVAKTFRFEVERVVGSDVQDVLEKCRKIALERQNKAARPNPGVPFVRFSNLELECTKGSERIQVQRTLKTAP
jgi:hypothetical protein